MTLPPRLPAPSARFLKALAACCLSLAALFSAPPGVQAEERFIPDDLRACAPQLPADGYAMPCKAPLSSAERAALAGRLGERGFAYAVEGDSLLLVLKMAASALPYPRGPYICCEIQAYLDPAGTDLHAARIRWNRMPEALLDLHLLDVQDRPDAIVRHRGSPAFVMPAAGPAQQALAASGIAVVTETIDAGPVLGRRKLTVATGARCTATLDGCTVVYMPDGGSTASLVRNAQDNGADMHGFVVVGLHNAETDPIGSRIGELLAGQEPARHQAYLRFMVEQLPARIEGGARPRRRLAAGYSNGGA
ncbi:hypothetical protein [Massilia sp. MS-15]|uniref:hypothetical protein n=1 Tax=Massilia sp. MS-15 TaxID=2878200 RepID=UPI001CD5A1DC|nr:hypothetical protein [Massilia sp. MS-15]MCA1246330.1 hypothetical protein [Massilia sp. MS-15]